jgi:choline dehydrogenase
MRSGIGPTEHLDNHGIPVRLHLRGVGQNLHNHMGTSLAYRLSAAGRRALEDDSARGAFYESQVILRAHSRESSATFDLHLLPYQTATDNEWISGVLIYNMAPQSRGEVLLSGSGPELPPRINFRYFTDSEGRDISRVVEGLRIARRLSQTQPLLSVIEEETEPGPWVSTGHDLAAYTRSAVVGYSHPVGTCKMGPPADPMAVADSNGRVYGTENVYVADASIIPQIPRANTNLTCMLIGLRMAHYLSGQA